MTRKTISFLERLWSTFWFLTLFSSDAFSFQNFEEVVMYRDRFQYNEIKHLIYITLVIKRIEKWSGLLVKTDKVLLVGKKPKQIMSVTWSYCNCVQFCCEKVIQIPPEIWKPLARSIYTISFRRWSIIPTVHFLPRLWATVQLELYFGGAAAASFDFYVPSL